MYGICRESMTLCNVCGRPLPVYEKIVDNMQYEYTYFYHTKEWNTRDIFPDLCESCARSIDRALRKMKREMIQREEVLRTYKQLNEERKERMNSNG